MSKPVIIGLGAYRQRNGRCVFVQAKVGQRWLCGAWLYEDDGRFYPVRHPCAHGPHEKDIVALWDGDNAIPFDVKQDNAPVELSPAAKIVLDWFALEEPSMLLTQWCGERGVSVMEYGDAIDELLAAGFIAPPQKNAH